MASLSTITNSAAMVEDFLLSRLPMVQLVQLWYALVGDSIPVRTGGEEERRIIYKYTWNWQLEVRVREQSLLRQLTIAKYKRERGTGTTSDF